MFYYVRWPNGDQTIAFATSKMQLWEMLDEEGDAVDALLKVIPRRVYSTGFAFDFTCDEREDEEGTSYHAHFYESARHLMSEYSTLEDHKLTPGREFFKSEFFETEPRVDHVPSTSS